MAEKSLAFENSGRFNGQVVRINRLSRGTDKNNREYVSYRGALRVGEEGHLYEFEGMSYKTSKDGKPLKSYERVVNWFGEVYDAIQEDRPIPEVFVSIVGSLEARDYVAADGSLREVNGFRVGQVLDYTKDPEGDDAYMNIQGFLRSTRPEINPETEEETGRLIISIITTNFRNEAVIIPKIIVDAEGADYINDNFEVGSRVGVSLGYEWTQGASTPAPKVGLGRKKDTNIVSRPTKDFILLGMDLPFEDDNIKENKELMKALSSEREAMLASLEEEGYKGSSSKPTSPKQGYTKTTSIATDPISDDDIPF